MEASPDGLQHALRDRDPAVRAEAWEHLVLRVLGLDAASAPVERWGRVYAEVSAALSGDAADLGPSSSLANPHVEAADLDAVWALIYGARTLHVARHLGTLVPRPPEGPILDIGAGWGPWALALALDAPGAAVHLADVSATRLARAEALFEAAGLPRPQVHAGRADPARLPSPGWAIIGFAYAWGELHAGDDPGAAARALRRWTATRAPGGQLWLLEPGTRAAARRLQAVRDAIGAATEPTILGPCPAPAPCPLLTRANDWCHFTWRLPLGPLGQRIADRAQRRWQEVHSTWLVLGDGDPSGGARVLERRALKGKTTLHLCAAPDAPVVTALRRDREVQRHLESLGPGRLVDLDREALQASGDGLRVRDPRALRPRFRGDAEGM